MNAASEFDPAQIYRALLQAGHAWADAKAAYQALDDATKSVLAKCKNLEDANSEAARERMGLTSKPYIEHLGSVAEARQAYLRAQVLYDSLRTLAELRRSEAATARAEMQHIGVLT